MKTLESIEFSKTQFDELEHQARSRGISVSELVEEFTRKSLDKATHKHLRSAEIVSLETLKRFGEES